MNRLHLTTVLSTVALALVLPAWAIAPSDQAKEKGTTTMSDQANQESSRGDAATPSQGDLGKAQGESSAGEQKPHGPTAIMDRATPTEKAETGDASAKHPPTARMDRSTPDQKSTASSGTDVPR
jgi:hypothetical protein